MHMRMFFILLSGFLALWIGGCGQKQADVIQWTLQKQCDLHQGPCTARRGDRNVTLEISPRPIPVAKPFDIVVRLTNLPAKAVALDIAGLNMYMGYIRVPLHAVEPGLWRGKGILAFCTSQVMQWRLSVLITRPDGQREQIPFYLETQRPGLSATSPSSP